MILTEWGNNITKITIITTKINILVFNNSSATIQTDESKTLNINDKKKNKLKNDDHPNIYTYTRLYCT